MNIHYFILKTYSGKVKKHKGNTHLLILPLSQNRYVYLGILGEILNYREPLPVYAARLIVKLPENLLRPIITGEEDYFEDRFVHMESLPCEVERLGQSNTYNITLNKRGKYFLSPNIELKYTPKFNNKEQNIYIYQLRGKFNFINSDTISNQTIKMMAMKQVAFMYKPRDRFPRFNIIN